jgi:hypothetical protein
MASPFLELARAEPTLAISIESGQLSQVALAAI